MTLGSRAVLRPLQAFLRLEAASGILLLGCAVAALLWANLHAESYGLAFGIRLLGLINDGLMTLFFFVVGMEIKRELVAGELSSLGKSSLPVIAALGGMLVPAGIFLAFNQGTPGQAGWGIPMATDIAFCVGILTLLEDRVPRGLVVFVTALAIFDDIGGIIVIAIFYGHGLSVRWLLGAAALSLGLVFMGRRQVASGLAYGLAGLLLWYAFHRGGVHPTIAGVVVGLSIPARGELLTRWVRGWHPFVAFLIMPLFALANAGVPLRSLGAGGLISPVALGSGLGLFVGKQLGVFGAALAAIRLGIAPMPGNASVTKLFGVCVLAGIGFTVALFIATLAYGNESPLLDQAKLGIVIGSLLAGALGFAILRMTRRAA